MGKTLPSAEALAEISKSFGLTLDELISEQEKFVAEAYKKGGSKGKREAEALVDDVNRQFADDRISQDEKDAVMRAIQRAYWIAKEESKRKYTPKKYRKVEE